LTSLVRSDDSDLSELDQNEIFRAVVIAILSSDETRSDETGSDGTESDEIDVFSEFKLDRSEIVGSDIDGIVDEFSE
jgi:hypothetical protein